MGRTEDLYRRLMTGAFLLKQANGVGPACRDRGDIFFLENLYETASRTAAEEFARELCAECPLLFACRDYALEAKEEDGIWGGMTPRERRERLSKP